MSRPEPLRTLPEQAFRARARLVALLLCGICFAGLIARLYRLQLAADNVAAERETFLFNNRLEALSRNARIDELEAVMREDERIVRLRANVRQAAESQLKGGVIDAHTLLTAITDEEQARLTAAYHEIQFMQSIYELKYTLNR